MRLTISGGEARMASPFYPGAEVIAAVKTLRGRRYQNKVWTAPAGVNATDLLGLVRDGVLTADEQAIEALEQMLGEQAEALSLSKATCLEPQDDVADLELGGELLPFQHAGVAFCRQNKRVLLMDDMGIGKTTQAVVSIWDRPRAVIVCPNSVKLHWQRMISQWLGRESRVLYGTRPVTVTGDQPMILNWDILWSWVDALIAWNPQALVFDESHRAKSNRARRTKAAKRLARGRHMVLALSGTPVTKATYDLITQLQLINRLNDLGGYREFTHRYLIRSPWGGYEPKGKRLKELNERMRSLGIMIRRTKPEVLPELPDKRRVMMPLEVDRAKYRDLVEQAREEISRGRMEIIRATREGRDPEGWALAARMTAVTRLRKETARLKLGPAIEWLRDLDEKVVVFAKHRDITEALAEALNAPLIRGGVSAEARQAAQDRFQEDESCRSIVLNLVAGREGLTLTAASNVVLVEEDDSPLLCEQAEDRVLRIGQKNAVTAWYLLAQGTIEDVVHDRIWAKEEHLRTVTDGDNRNSLSQVVADYIMEGT